MNNIIFAISLFAATVSCLFSLAKQFQMLQQNSYYPSRYFSWIKNSFSLNLCLMAFVFCINSFLYTSHAYITQLIFTAVVLTVRIFSAVKSQKKSIKPLVFTARIKRLFASSAAVLAALSVVGVINDGLAGEICLFFAFLLSLVTPITVFTVWCINYPIEKAVSNWYVKDAKKILENHGNLTVVGITGSYGKTTTKFILNRILSEKFNTVCTPQSFNTPMGVVRTVRELIRPQTNIFICEMGAKNVGDIKEICDIAHPKYGIITSVGAQHLETFKSVENVFKTKFELADEVLKSGGKVLVNNDSQEINKNAERENENIIFYGKDTKYFADKISFSSEGSKFTLNLDGEKIKVSTRLLGMHSVSDILAASSLAYMLGVKPKDIAFAISSLKPTEHRLEMKRFTNGSTLIDDAYNSNPEGCLEAVRILSDFKNMKKVIITPGLIELGEKEYECNYNLGLEAAKECDIIILVGKNRSKPMCDAISETDFNPENLHIVSSFAEGLGIYNSVANEKTVLLIENDLPDNYLN